MSFMFYLMQCRIDTLFCNIINTCVDMYNRGLFMYPSEKHGIVKVIGFSLFLLDGTEFNINKMDGKKLNLSKIDRIFKVWSEKSEK